VQPLEGDERIEANLRYRRKREDKRFYDDVKTIVDEFADGSDDMIHPWSSDIVEGMNKFFTKFLPKDRTYGMSIENRVRLHLAVCIDSISYVETYQRLAQKLGLELGEVTKEMNKLLDIRKRYLRKHRKKKKTRATRKRKYYEKLREQSSKMVQENRKNLLYGSGITGVFAEDRPPEPSASLPAATITEETAATMGGTNSREGPDGKVEWRCQQCLLWGHRRTSSSACLKNKKRLSERLSVERIIDENQREISEGA
jgi:hypothetical protein